MNLLRFRSMRIEMPAKNATFSGQFQLRQTIMMAPKARFNSNQSKAFEGIAKDGLFNVPQSIQDKIGRNIHLIPNHPVNTIKKRIEQHFQLGNQRTNRFEIFDRFSPIVSTHQCFDSLLVPPQHESRLPQNSYYINQNTMLRAHTSAHQTELLEKGKKAFLVSGDVYRRDEIDATHYPVFHQMEGVRVFDEEELKGANNREQRVKLVEEDMKWWLEGAVRAIFGQNLQIRWVDAYFPFTEPSFEVEVFYNGKWLEVLGCGVVHQKILKNVGLEDKVGWAFGIGLERLAMVLFEIPDIRLFWTDDKRFHDQFPSDQIVKFKHYSKFPPCTKDISFWTTPKYHSNDFYEVVRSIGGDLIESVELVDKFSHPKTNRDSHCYRINFRSMDRNLTNEEINQLQEGIREQVAVQLGVELR
eukprot:TRINITY_DN7261_c0_g1_i1.p1 TRINITY_DN7261_c0_g1~~TRINITY_DN7261_c0_g1_i1.p1  ORF type:complete len:414 (-),score=131.27 TRINITY_DN7261_c0_g1_i1:145-1386(-)